ncbi:Mitochondrial ribonuclease p protein 1, partial [Fasciolopsis buskii]
SIEDPFPASNLPAAGSDRIIRVVDPKHCRSHNEGWMWAEVRCPDSAQQLVFDFTHESEMRLQDQKNLAAQFAYVMQTTRQMRPYPFHLWLCGLKSGTNQYSFMEQQFGMKFEHYSKEFPLNDPNRPVIYLSPNAHRSFEPGEWDHNAVYVVGAIVDKAVRRPVTFARARRAGVECIRLPLERYFKWSSGSSKTLTINCIYSILATAKSTNGDWETALRSHLPRRLYARDEQPHAKLNKLFTMI